MQLLKSFFHTRHELKGLTLKNLHSLCNTDLELISMRSRISSWRVLLLSDDDDWVAPDWLEGLPRDTSKLLFVAGSRFVLMGLGCQAQIKKYSFTNNYCVFPLAEIHMISPRFISI